MITEPARTLKRWFRLFHCQILEVQFIGADATSLRTSTPSDLVSKLTLLLFVHKCDDPAEGCFTTFKIPWEDTNVHTLILQLGRPDITTKVFSVHTIVWEEGVVG